MRDGRLNNCKRVNGMMGSTKIKMQRRAMIPTHSAMRPNGLAQRPRSVDGLNTTMPVATGAGTGLRPVLWLDPHGRNAGRSRRHGTFAKLTPGMVAQFQRPHERGHERTVPGDMHITKVTIDPGQGTVQRGSLTPRRRWT